MFKGINEANQVLSNPSSKAIYDRQLAQQSNNNPGIATQTYITPAQSTTSSRFANAATTIKNANRFTSSPKALMAPATPTSMALVPYSGQ